MKLGYVLLIAALMAVGTAATAGQPLQLVLLRSISSFDKQIGELVAMQEPKANGCRYVGTLEQKALPQDTMAKLIAAAKLPGDSGAWWIKVSTASCQAGEVTSASLWVPLNPRTYYPAGATVSAFVE